MAHSGLATRMCRTQAAFAFSAGERQEEDSLGELDHASDTDGQGLPA